jgi:hypothetical protein
VYSYYKVWYFKIENENLEAKLKKIEQKYASIQIVKLIEQFGNEKVSIDLTFIT